jgi:hypothetical protein
MKKLLCIAVLFLFSMLIIPLDGKTAAPAQQKPVWTNTNKLKNVKPIPAQPTQKSRAVASDNEKQLPSIEFQSVKTKRLSTGEWRWEVHIKATQNRQVAPNTARVRVWQNAGGKKRLLATRTYDRPINPGYGLLVDRFLPSGESDTLDFELIELKPTSSGLTTNQNANNVVDRATSGVPPFGITMKKYGYSYHPEPAYFYCDLNNSSAFPMRVRVVMRGGKQSTWTTVRHREKVVVKSGETLRVRKDWTHTEKGYAYFKISAEAQLLDPETGNVTWTEIIGHKGILPTLK